MPFLDPPQWTDAELKAGRDRAEQLFTELRREEGPLTFERMYHRLRPEVENLFVATNNLRQVTGQVFLDDPFAWQPARYVCGPPISQEDLWTLVGGSKFKKVPPRLADDTADAVRVVIDPVRFSWIEQRRDPSVEERERALQSTTLLWARERLGTERRLDSSTRQERVTGEALASAGLTFDPSRSKVQLLDDMARGTYSRERVVSSSKCDVPVRLRDGRLFALECKVSNGPKNGWKRINREVGGKATNWRQTFGSSLITGVVVAGVFDLSALTSARDQGVVIFWEHDLQPLVDFVAAATA
ncbi:XamI family restriction endonuclease [Microbacterium sp. CIAB417]|uniref:XamI family restriction endonuclease n=1 Tax=Microbacterium sp. CIAB417 TaxID=2860287 RepID=UPI001FAC7185|nr:XamI family restriction endonuclease [Microbacterium sp. CIAB417]